jgi:hypothetical protein
MLSKIPKEFYTILLLLLTLVQRSEVHADTPVAKIQGPSEATAGDLIILRSEGSKGKLFHWEMIRGEKSYLPVPNSQYPSPDCVFASATPGTYTFLLIVFSEDDQQKEILATKAIHTIKLTSLGPSPTPNPTPNPTPDPIPTPDPRPPPIAERLYGTYITDFSLESVTQASIKTNIAVQNALKERDIRQLNLYSSQISEQLKHQLRSFPVFVVQKQDGSIVKVLENPTAEDIITCVKSIRGR